MNETMDIEPLLRVFNTGAVVYYFPKYPTPQLGDLRVGIYIRVSTKLQEHKFSLKAQIQELVRYAKQMGWVILGIYRDVDSGGKLDKNGLNQLLDDVEESKLDVVLCIDQDRLSRLDTVAWEYLKSTLRDNHVKIAEPGNITDLANEDDEFISDIKNLIARREKKGVVRRMMRGKRQRTREGKGWGKSAWEYNYDKNTSAYSIKEELAWVIPFIDELYLKDNLSDAAIARRLNDIRKSPSGKPWNETHVAQRLTKKLYHGVLEKTFSNGETITVPNVYPPLRSEDTWYKIQVKRKSKYQRKGPIHPNILRNIMTICGCCGRKLCIKQCGLKAPYHFYYKHSREYSDIYDPNCRMSINSIRVEINLIKAIKEILTSEDTARRYIQFEYSRSDVDQLTKDISVTNKLMQGVQQKIDRLLPLYLEGSFTKEALNAQKETLENELQVHAKRKRQLETKKEAIAANLFNYETIYQYLAIAERFEVELSEAEKMELVGRLFPSGTLYEDRFILQGNAGGILFETNVPVAPNPFAYKIKEGRQKRERVTRSSLGWKKQAKSNEEQMGM